MRTHIRTVGFLFLGMGVVIGALTALSMFGAFPLDIRVFDYHLDTPQERRVVLAVWSTIAVAGGALLRFSRRPAGRAPKTLA